MALTVGTNTYISKTDADVYLTNAYMSSDVKLIAWQALYITDAEVCLKKAAQIIDRQPLMGFKVDSNQTMAFPRVIYTTYNWHNDDPIKRYGNGWYEQTETPDVVKYAQCEIAIELAQGTNERQELQKAGVSSFRAGNLSESYDGAINNVVSNEAKMLLQSFIGGSYLIC